MSIPTIISPSIHSNSNFSPSLNIPTPESDSTSSLTILSVLIDQELWQDATKRIHSNPNEVQTWNANNLPLHHASRNHKTPLKILETLIEIFPQAIKEQTISNGEIPIHVACHPLYNANYDAVELLLNYYKEGVEIKNKYGNTPLHVHLLYQEEPNIKIVRLLVKTQRKLVQFSNNDGWYPLHCCVSSGNIQLAKAFVKLYPKALIEKDRFGMNPQELAKDGGLKELAEYLLKEEENIFGRREERDECEQ